MASAQVELIKVSRSTDLAWPDLWPEAIGIVVVGKTGKIAYFHDDENDAHVERRISAKIGKQGKIRDLDVDAQEFIDISCAIEEILRGNGALLEEAEDFEVEIDFMLSEGLSTAGEPKTDLPGEEIGFKEMSPVQDTTGASQEMKDPFYHFNMLLNMPFLDLTPEPVELEAENDHQAKPGETPLAPVSAPVSDPCWLPAGEANPRSFMSWGKITLHKGYLVFTSALVKSTKKDPLSEAAIIDSSDISINPSGLAIRGPASDARPIIAVQQDVFLANINEGEVVDAHLVMDLENFYLTIMQAPVLTKPVEPAIEEKKGAKRLMLPYLLIALLTVMGVAAVAASGFSGGKSFGGDKADSAVGSIRDGLFGG